MVTVGRTDATGFLHKFYEQKMISLQQMKFRMANYWKIKSDYSVELMYERISLLSFSVTTAAGKDLKLGATVLALSSISINPMPPLLFTSASFQLGESPSLLAQTTIFPLTIVSFNESIRQFLKHFGYY